MKKGLILAGVTLIIIGVVGYLVFAKVFVKPGKAALQIASTPDTKVFLNDEESGITPYFNDKLEASEYTVKLVPQNGEDLINWEGKVSLVPNIVTSITYQLGTSEDLSSGEILSLEKITDSKASALAVVSQPDEALVKINGESKGFAPVLVDGLPSGEYQITISAPGFVEKTISAQTVSGYKLTLSIKLAREELGDVAEATESAEEETEEEKETENTEEEETEVSPTPISLEKPYVKIRSTPTGWLRVRMGPNTSATEAAKVNPGEAFPYLDEEENGWYKIEYEKGEEGWVSGVYAELVK
ncbi:MAG TPA: PEGA domain-containing protein [Candidatus Bathyarchaeia archaeon]|nr:PEGA domain-containing protein [Candidatus Bathyarchaeia archaeon]